MSDHVRGRREAAAAAVEAGLRETLLTPAVRAEIGVAEGLGLQADLVALGRGDAADRLARHVDQLVRRVLGGVETDADLERAVNVVADTVAALGSIAKADLSSQVLEDPPQLLQALLRIRQDGQPESVVRPLTPLGDTTLFTNARGEPAVGSELQAEIDSANEIDVIVAFVRWSGIRPLLTALERHCRRGRRLRVLTTTYTGSTEQRALDALSEIGAEIRVSYDTTVTRLHAKAWHFRRKGGYSTAYVGSSNLTYSAQVAGLEWNLRLSGIRNADAVAKVAAAFESYWEGGDFIAYDPAEFRERLRLARPKDSETVSPVEVVLRPFQERLLEQVEVARARGYHRNLLVAATGTGKTVMAAVDYARLRRSLSRSRLLFVAHRNEILEQSRRVFRQALQDPGFGELWVAGKRPEEFEHVFASVQSLHQAVDRIDPAHYDVVVVDEFHHAAAPTYERLLARVDPVELLGLTATPERADGLEVLSYFDGRIAAELRIWDAIDQQYLCPFAYYGVHDGADLRNVPWRRGRGYDLSALENVYTADHAWGNSIVSQVARYVGDVHTMRALGFCVSVAHAKFMAERFNAHGIAAAALSATSGLAERSSALAQLAAGRLNVLFAVDIFNEGIDVPTADTILMLRPTESATLFLQQLGRGLRRAEGKTVCTVLDFVGQHRREFRFDRRLRALLGGSRREIQRQVEQDFPFLPAGCTFELDRVSRDIVLSSLRQALPTRWNEKCDELRSLGDVSLATFLIETGLELDDVYTGDHGWTEMRRAAGLRTAEPGVDERTLLRAIGRLRHINDSERIGEYRRFLALPTAPSPASLSSRETRLLRMLVETMVPGDRNPSDAANTLWQNPQARSEMLDLLDVLETSLDHLTHPLGIGRDIPLRVHGRYTRVEILAALAADPDSRLRPWREGVFRDDDNELDVFAFTLDKSSGAFSPTTRYEDYAISRTLIHWQTQSGTTAASPTGQRYINHSVHGTNILLFARVHADDRAFWCLGAADYVRHQGDRPVSFVWRLRTPLPGDLYTEFAAVAA